MQDETRAGRVTGAQAGSRGASGRTWYGGVAGIVAVCALSMSVLLAGAHQIREDRERRSERAELAQAAASDRRARDDQIRVWTVALNTDPGSALALAQLAALNVQKARETGQEEYYPVAEAMARRSLDLRTQRNARTYVVLASALLAQHRFSEARSAAAEAFALEPDVAQYRALLAEIDMELGDYGAAAQGFAGLMRYRTHLSVGPRLARWQEVQGHAHGAREILEDLVTQAGQRRDLPREQLAWFHFRLGDHYQRHGSPRRARASLARALDVNPGDYRAHKALAELDLAAGNIKEAAQHARAAVAVSRTPETLLILASVLRTATDTAAARVVEAEVAGAIGVDGGSFERAWHSHRLEWRLPVPGLTTLLEREARERGDVQGYDLLAWSYYKANNVNAARGAIASALRTGTSDATVWFHAGMIAHASQDTQRAGAYLRNALTLNPHFHRGHAATARALLESIDDEAPGG